jgi:hypothetical protein
MPHQLAKINESGLLELIPETLELVKGSYPPRIEWVVVFGVGRGGKSTLCNLISSMPLTVILSLVL